MDGIKPNLTFMNQKDGIIQLDYDDALITGVDEQENDQPPNNDGNKNFDEQKELEENSIDEQHNDDSDDLYCESEHEDMNDLENEGLLNPGVNTNEVKDAQDQQEEREIEYDDEKQQQYDQTIEEVPQLRQSTRRPVPTKNYEPTMSGKKYESKTTNVQTNHLNTQSHRNTFQYDETEAIILGHAFAVTYSLSQGLKKFGQKGHDATFEEVKQLHDITVFKPIDVNTLTPQEQKRALESIIFLTEKQDGRIKARACANGSKQRQWMNKEESASPTVSLESVFLTAVIEDKENRDVAVVDIPNAFVQTPNEGQRLYYLQNGVVVLYLDILMAIYGMIQSSLLFYKKLRKDL